MILVGRSAWGAERPTRAMSRLDKPEGCVIHWNGPPMGLSGDDDHPRCDDKVRGIQAFHQNTKGWADIAYTVCVCPHRSVFLGRGFGYRTAANGTNDANARYLAIMYLGGADELTPDGLAGVVEARTHLMSLGMGGVVLAHSDVRDTDCPGADLRRHLDDIRYPGAVTQPEIPLKVEYVMPSLLTVGTTGKSVKKLQGLLVAHGHVSVKVDGDFGPQTERALSAHKKAWGLPDPTVADAAAWRSLIEG